jgi:hypothetical protein
MYYDTLCLSGGSDRGIAFLGVLDYLQENHNFNINNIKSFIGTSVGSIIIFFINIGYTIHEMGEFILCFDVSKLQNDITVENLLVRYGLNDGCNFVYLLQCFLNNKLNVNDITFIELYKMTNKKLTIIGTNFTKGIEAVFNHINTPNMSVITAVRISISVPLVFTPVLYNNEYYIDGGIVNNMPVNYGNMKTTLAIYIKYNNSKNNCGSLFEFFKGCMNIISDTITEKDCSDSLNVITVCEEATDIIDFNIDITKKIKYIHNGQMCAKKYIDSIPTKIASNILNNIIKNIN